MVDKRLQIGTWAIVALILLRVAVGWHFFKEGAKKFTDPGFSSAGFLSQAKGPLAGMYTGMVPRKDDTQWLDEQGTIDTWAAYRNAAGRHFGFDDAQATKATKSYEARVKQLHRYMGDRGDDLKRYLNSHAQIEEMKSSPIHTELASLQEHITRNQSELAGGADEWVARVKDYWRALEHDMRDIATEEQRERGEFSIVEFDQGGGGLALVDCVIPWVTLLVGVCLVLGLFTRPAAIVGVLFLLSVVASQFPGSEGATPTYNQVVEICGLIVLATTGAGRFAGLDHFVYKCCGSCCKSKKEASNESDA